MLISAVQQSDSVTYMHTFFFIFFSTMVYHRVFSIVLCAVGPCCLSILFFIYINLFIYLWLRWIFIAALGLSLVGGEQGLPFVAVPELLIAVASLVVEHGLYACGLQ